MHAVVPLDSASIRVDQAGTTAAFPWLVSVGSLRASAAVGENRSTEASSLTITIANDGREAARILREPLRRSVNVYDDAGRLFFGGTVQRVEPGRTMKVTLEGGGGGRLLSEPLPMRTTRELGNYSADVPIPLRFGDLSARRFDLVRLTATDYLAAGHAMDVLEVFIDDEATEAFELDVGRDEVGRIWQIVRFGSPVGQGQKASATGRGMRNPATGALVENPADVIEHVLGLAGIEAVFSRLRSECDAEGLRVAGSLTAARSVRVIVDEIAASIGAVWTLTGARLYPTPGDPAGPIFDLEAAVVGGLDDPIADLADTADALRVGYDFAQASGRAQRHVELSASPRRFGGVSAEVSLPWLYLPANAESVGGRILARKAGRRFRVGMTIDRHDLRPGDYVRLVDNPEWRVSDDDPLAMLLEVEVEANAGATRAVGEVLLSSPVVSVTAHAVALPDTSAGGIDIAFRDGVATFTVRDDEGRPLAGARVSLDGGEPRTTNDQGLVSFTTTQGRHELLVEVAGFATQRIEFDL